MKKAKKILLTAGAYLLTAALAIGGTVAYLQSEDSDVNVMTLGNVKIEQIEEQLAEDGVTKEPFEQAKDLYPGTDVSKIVSVKNTGKSDAFFRTLIAFEYIDSETFDFGFPIGEFSGYKWSWGAPEATIVIDGVTYQVYEAVYTKALKADETSPASLTRVELAATCTNEDMEKLGGAYDILVLSQAVQTAGFSDAQTALDTAFGDVTEAKAAEWFSGEEFTVPTVASNADEIVDAISAGEDVMLNEDIVIEDTLNITTPTKIDLNGHSLTVEVLEAKEDTTITGGAITLARTTYPALSVSSGTLTLNDVDIVCNEPCHVTYDPSGTLSIAEYVGLEIWSGKCVLNNSTITVNCTEKRYGNTVFGVGIHGGELTMNGGAIKVTSAGSHQARYEAQAAIFAGSETEKVINLNNVDVDAKLLIEAWGGNTVINTTDAEGTWDGKCNTKHSGSYQINYVK